MDSDEYKDQPSNLKYLDVCLEAVNQSDYVEVLLTLRKGIERSLPYAKEVDAYQFLTKLLSVLLTLESHLNWEVSESLRRPVQTSQGQTKANEPRCSFCGKTQAEVVQLIAGPNIYVCNECVGICNKILAGNR